MIGEAIGAIGVGDVDLDDHQVRMIVGVYFFDVLVDELDLVVVGKVGGECC